MNRSISSPRSASTITARWNLARKLIDGAIFAGADAVKFQKRTPELCVPRDQWNIERDTPWGRITYLEYRHKMEFTYEQYRTIDRYCRARNLDWFVSCWDEAAVDFMEQFDTPMYKVASATLTDLPLLRKMKDTVGRSCSPPACRRCGKFRPR